MTPTPDKNQDSPDNTGTSGTTPGRGEDDRRTAVDPAQNPAPRSPTPDQEAVQKGEEILERIKPY